MLNLSDADLARLRLDALIAVRNGGAIYPHDEKTAGRIIAWCLRDKEIPQE